MLITLNEPSNSNRLMRFVELMVAAGVCRILERCNQFWELEVYVRPECESMFRTVADQQHVTCHFGNPDPRIVTT